MFKKLLLAAVAAIIIPFICSAQHSFETYYQLSDFMQAPSTAFKFGLYGFDNPVTTTYLKDADMMLTLSGQNGDMGKFNRYGLFSGGPHSGFGLLSNSDGSFTVYDYRYSVSFGDKIFGMGIGYGFTGGDKSHYRRSNILSWGAMYRPIGNLSVGFHQTFGLDRNDFESVGQLGIRPLKDYPLTFFGDFSMFNNDQIKDIHWSAGVSWEFLPGVRLNGRYFDNKMMSIGADISFGKFGIAAGNNFNSEGGSGFSTATIRFGAQDRTIIESVFEKNKYLKLAIPGNIKYRKNIFFDNSVTLMSFLKIIEAAKNDPSISGIVLNATNMGANRELLWEIREKLLEFKAIGKKLFIFIERVGIKGYHFASIADAIIIDPIGSIALEGFAMGRSYYKNFLAKAGLGFEEFRYFKYKSAVEVYARDKMSEGEREQRQRLLDDWFEQVRKETCQSRKSISEAQFDALTEEQMIYTPKNAKDKRLVDTFGRWNDVEKIMKNLDSLFGGFKGIREITEDKKPIDDRWGRCESEIAVIYVIGSCAMDEGIKARKLVNDVKWAAENDNIKAIVLRIDSPGGDAMASDYIADVVRKFKDKKPFIVSQGAVAASGGYWLSMDAHKIVAAPMTITGSIGVIGGFFYNKGLFDSLGIAADVLKKGKYSDLGYPVVFPFLPIGIPSRGPSVDEKASIETMIKSFYKDFVGMVAEGRKMNPDSIEKVAQGRVWTGSDGLKIGLVDKLGGLETAIAIAKESAGLKKDEKVSMIELPKPEFFDFSELLNSLMGFNVKDMTAPASHLLFRMKNNGIPLAVVPMDYMDYTIEE
ncbi:MAG: Periplasmic serine protease [Ignavibacteria bacterium]|nr:Periplasmic serine protease [Ignavibacteria bacterium]